MTILVTVMACSLASVALSAYTVLTVRRAARLRGEWIEKVRDRR